MPRREINEQESDYCHAECEFLTRTDIDYVRRDTGTEVCYDFYYCTKTGLKVLLGGKPCKIGGCGERGGGFRRWSLSKLIYYLPIYKQFRVENLSTKELSNIYYLEVTQVRHIIAETFDLHCRMQDCILLPYYHLSSGGVGQ